MSDTEGMPENAISRELARFAAECETIGAAMAMAAERLARLEALPEAALVGGIEQLRTGCRSLVELAEVANAPWGDRNGRSPGREAELAAAIGFARGVAASQLDQSARTARGARDARQAGGSDPGRRH